MHLSCWPSVPGVVIGHPHCRTRHGQLMQGQPPGVPQHTWPCWQPLQHGEHQQAAHAQKHECANRSDQHEGVTPGVNCELHLWLELCTGLLPHSCCPFIKTIKHTCMCRPTQVPLAYSTVTPQTPCTPSSSTSSAAHALSTTQHRPRTCCSNRTQGSP